MKKIIAIMLALVLVVGVSGSALAARCPNCNVSGIREYCNTNLGRADSPYWISCPISSGCTYDTISYWTGMSCSSCHHTDNAYTTHRHRLNHRVCTESQYTADVCPY